MEKPTLPKSSINSMLKERLQADDAGEIFARSVLEQAAEAIVVCDREGRILLANKVAQDLCGRDPVGEEFDHVFPLRQGRGPRPWHLLERRKQPRLGPSLSVSSICQGESLHREQVCLERPGETRFNLLISSGPLVSDGNQPIGCIITLSDVTECMRAEDDLLETQARFRRLAESNIVGIVYADDERILEANDAFLQMVGYTREDLDAGRISWREMTPPEFHELTERKVQELLTSGRSMPYEKEYIRKDGTRVPLLIVTVLMDATPFRSVGFAVDLRHRRLTEQALRHSESDLQQAKDNLELRVRVRTAELAEINQALQAEVLERRKTEEALRVSRAEFQALLESAPDAFLSVNAAGRITLVNSQIEKMFGYRRDELLGQPVEMLLPSRYHNVHIRYRTAYSDQPTTRPMGIGLDLAGRRKDGSEFPVEVSLSPVQTLDDTHVMSVIRDITERKRAEKERAEQARRLQERTNLIELAHDTIIVRDMNDQIVFWNHGAEETYGWTKEQALGQSPHVLLRTQFPEPLEQLNRRLETEGQWEGELVHSTRDGRKLIVASRQVLQRDESGAPRAIMEINRDVTARKEAEERLSESETRFRTLVQQVRDYAIFGLDAQGNIVSWNVGAERLNGYRADEIVGKSFSIFFSHEDIARGKPQEELRRAAAEGRYEEEAERVRKDGSRYWADVVITALREPNGELRGFSKVIRDITVRKRSEEEIRKLNSELGRRVDELAAVNLELEAFSYSVSHDLRAPLRGIAGFAQALSEDYGEALDDQAKDYTRRINAATQRMTQLIDDLLMLSRVTRSEMNRDQRVDLSAIAQSIAAQLQAAQPERRVEFAIVPRLVTQGDPRLLRIALENFMGNAFKFTSKTPEARIEFGSAGTEDGKTVYFVRDNGAGFDMTYADKLFGPFQRLHAATEFPGTGIGLATVQRIIRRHGGRVWASSTVGQGATFYFTL